MWLTIGARQIIVNHQVELYLKTSANKTVAAKLRWIARKAGSYSAHFHPHHEFSAWLMRQHKGRR
jgi:hypothetical protein